MAGKLSRAPAHAATCSFKSLVSRAGCGTFAGGGDALLCFPVTSSNTAFLVHHQNYHVDYNHQNKVLDLLLALFEQELQQRLQGKVHKDKFG
jgi:hypothetical protein